MDSSLTSSAERRAYWVQAMDAGYAFILTMMDYPIRECGEPLVSLEEAAGDAGVEVAFSMKPHAQGFPRIFYLREGLITAFLNTARVMNARGWVLKIEDAYRSEAMQAALAISQSTLMAIYEKCVWECNGQSPPVELVFNRVSTLTANSPKVGTHMSGSALDISVIRRDNGTEIDRGAAYLEMSELTPMTSPFISDTASENRREITALMQRYGFVTYPWEFWHYCGGDAYAGYFKQTGKPARYGPVHASFPTGAVIPIDNPTKLLNSPEEIVNAIQRLSNMLHR